MRALHRLTSTQIKAAGPGKLLDGGGLWLHKRGGGGQWFLRVTVGGRRREMGLGSLDAVPLREARKAAARWRAEVAAGRDPIKLRERERRDAAKLRPTLAAVVAEAFESRKASLKGDGTAGRWLSAVNHHVLPKLGRVPIEDIDQNDLARTLRPLWADQSPTAKTALSRLKVIFAHAVAKGLPVDLTAPEKARILLGASRHTRINIPALDWQEVPTFYRTLVDDDGNVAALVLRLLVLTATRSAEARGLMLDEIDGNTWSIPAARTKGKRLHRVALSREALAVIDEAKPLARNGLLFASRAGGAGPVLDGALSRYMRDRGMLARPHGFRSSFRVWCAETGVPREIAEACLGHIVDGSSAVERAYRRTDYLEQRLVLMNRWADHVTGRGGGAVHRLADASAS